MTLWFPTNFLRVITTCIELRNQFLTSTLLDSETDRAWKSIEKIFGIGLGFEYQENLHLTYRIYYTHVFDIFSFGLLYAHPLI